MGGKFVLFCLVLRSYTASSIPTSTTPMVTITNQEFLSPKPSSSYEVTENIVDIPDDRTLPPIIPNYSISQPMNIANISININQNPKNNTGDENNEIDKKIKTTFTYIHINKEKEKHGENGIKRLLRGITDYVYGLKRGVVDGLHSFFHRNEVGSKYDKKAEDFDKIFGKSDLDFETDNDSVYYDDFKTNDSKEKDKGRDIEFYSEFHNERFGKTQDEVHNHSKFYESYENQESSEEYVHDEYKHRHN